MQCFSSCAIPWDTKPSCTLHCVLLQCSLSVPAKCQTLVDFSHASDSAVYYCSVQNLEQ